MSLALIDLKGCLMHRFDRPAGGDTTRYNAASPDKRNGAGCSRRRALLIDLENMVRISDPRSAIGDWVEADDALAFLRRAILEAGEVQHALLAASAGVVTRYFGVVQALGIPCLPVDSSPDAADLALLERGEHLIRTGFSEVVVVSADHNFVRLADHCDCTVIVRVGQRVASTLRDSARHVVAA